MTSPTASPESLPSDDTSVKRRKLMQYDSENDSGDELLAGFIETDTLPLNNATVATQPLPTPTNPGMQPQAFVPASSPLPSNPAQQQTPAQSPSRLPPQIQVPASSPLRGVSSPVAQPPRPPIGQSVKPLDFYAAQPNPAPINLDVDGPVYVGSSSDGEHSDGGIMPMFGSTKLPISTSDSAVAQQRGEVPQQDANTVKREPISMGSLAAKFAYEPVNKGVRLDSLTRSSGYPRGASGAQRRPAPALPARDIDLDQLSNPDHKVKVTRMKTVLPNKTNRELLHALLSANSNYDDAMERLTSDDTVDLTVSGDEVGAKRGAIKTANRGAGAGKVAIKDKWSSTQAVRRRAQQSSPPPTGPVSRKRKLVKGSNTPLERSESPILIDDDDSDDSAIEQSDSDGERQLEGKVLEYVNLCTTKELCDIACTTEEIAEIIVSQRPFATLDEVRQVSAPAAKKSRGKRTKRIGDKVVDVCLETWTGYDAVDSLIRKVEAMGKPIAAAIRGWGVDVQTGNESGELEMVELNVESDSQSNKDSGIGSPTDDGDLEIKDSKRDKTTGAFKEQPKNMREGVVLKDYQLAGLNWLNLLYEKNLSCILADEMGLGKTCQVIAFFAHLLTKGVTGPHLVVVPSSTLENWLREFANFCPALKVEPYYGTQKDRPMIRDTLRKDRSWNVLVTTYQLATGDKVDRGFLKSLRFNCCVYDEGHLLKNGSSARYDSLIKLPADFRLLLTGTPLQNNLQELASLLAFILPSVFDEKREELASIFKYKAKTTDDDENSALLSQQRIRRARAMMTPFVLRRKKQQVLKHLPRKTSRVEYCTMNDEQSRIYQDVVASAQDAIAARAEGKKPNKNTANVMMQLRKAAIHPLLFRSNYPDDKLRKMTRDIMKEEAYETSNPQYVYEDMEVMNDLELSRLCSSVPRSLGKYALKKDEWMNAGKVKALTALLLEMRKKGDRVLIFSQFTQALDILEMVLTTLDMAYLRIDGSTPVDARQDLIDQYHTETDIMVFLLSTKAGGFGINLACANKVVIYDSSFNPHDDVQASDRAHRVGQTREVEVIRLITKGTIEEAILQLANTKLALDQCISEGDQKVIESKGEELVAKMLLKSAGGVGNEK